MLKTNKRKSLFSRILSRDGLLQLWSKPSKTGSLSGRYFRSIDEMPLCVFIEIIVTNDLSKMIIEGSVSDEVLLPVWSEILEQYLDVTFSEEDKHLVQLIFTHTLLEFNITKATAIQMYLQYRYDEDLVAIMQRIGAADTGYPKDGNINSRRVWHKRVTARIKRWKVQQSEIEAEIGRLSNKDEAKMPKITKAYFDDILVQLSRHFKYHVDETTVSVGRFLSMLRDYKNHLLTLQKQIKQA